MPRRQSRKARKAVRRQKKLKGEARRRRARIESQNASRETFERAYIDPVSLVMVRDLHKNTQIFWKHSTTYPDQIRRLSADACTSRQVLFGEHAQAILQPLMEGMLKAVRTLVEKHEAVRWLVLIRPNLSKYLGEFMGGKGYTDLSPQDRLGVLGMLELAVTEYGMREDYFARYGQLEVAQGCLLPEIVGKLPPIPEAEIVATRELLDYIVALYIFEKAFRSSGRGVGIAIESDGRIIQVVPTPIYDGLLIYDRRVQAQKESGQLFVSAGFPGFARLEESSPDHLFVMTRFDPEEYVQFAEQLRKHDPTDFNPINFCPALLDTSEAFEFLRQMPEGTARKTGGLSPDEIIVCLHAVSRIGIVAFNDRTTRFWIGCYGLFPIALAEFVKRFNFHVKEQLPNYSGGKIDELRDKFVKTFSLPQRQGYTEFDRSNVHRYMTASGALFIFDEEKSVMIDYLGLPNDLNSWLVSLRLDGTGKEPKRGILFEKWLRSELESCARASSLETNVMPKQGLGVKIEPQNPHTDIDVVLPIPPWLIVISCKNYEMKDGEFRGVAQDVRKRWDKLHGDLATWDDKMRRLFHNKGRDWRVLNPKLAELAEGCSNVLPILITPSSPW